MASPVALQENDEPGEVESEIQMIVKPGCPFCDIGQRPEPDTREVYRDEQVVAFFPTEPATLGHTLVIPRGHVDTIWNLEEAGAKELAAVTIRLAKAVREATGAPGLNVIQSNGETATQTIMHLHIHLVPRWPHDDLGQIWPRETSYSERQKDNVLENVRDSVLRLLVEADRHDE